MGQIEIPQRSGAADGRPIVVFDWKSDVAPTPADRQTYAAQLLEYMEAVGASRGAVVYLTLRELVWIDNEARVH
jgi:CRISPR-associated exonuclease Cas4